MVTGPPKTTQIARGIFDNPVALLHLAYARADTLRIELAYSSTETWIALFEFVMPINALRDWVKASRPELELELNKLIKQPAVAACADIANAGKHIAVERRHNVHTISHTDMVPWGTSNAAGNPEQRVWRLCVELDDGTRRYMEDIIDDALGLWSEFFDRHAVVGSAEL